MTDNYFSKFMRCYLIAEIGVNHNGDMGLARNMINAAKNAGADAVKFQTFTAENLASQETPKVRYQEDTTDTEESHYEMLNKLELSREDHFRLKEYTEMIGVDFMSTPYDIDSARFLNEELNVGCFKTASADIVDLSLHKYIASTGKPCLISVGMASLGEIEEVVNLYRKEGNDDIILLHCVSNYPCRSDSINLTVMNTLRQSFQVPVGYSDHSVGSEAAILSVALGAKVIEKHFTVDKELPGPDHKASSTAEEFSALVRSVRKAEEMLGSPVKKCQDEEEQMRKVSRKSICLAKDIAINEIITEEDLVFKRPGTGLPDSLVSFVIGRAASRDLKKDHVMTILDVQ